MVVGAAHHLAVDEANASPIELEVRVDGVSRRPRFLVHDHSLLAQKHVDEAGLADVGAPDHRQPQVHFDGVFGRKVGKREHDLVQEVAASLPAQSGNRRRSAETEFEELVVIRGPRELVDLVRGKDRGSTGSAQ